jgi:hypothetical protein
MIAHAITALNPWSGESAGEGSALKNLTCRLDDTNGEKGETSMTLFEREDWTLFRSLATLGQKAGAAGLGVLAWYELRDRRGGKS